MAGLLRCVRRIEGVIVFATTAAVALWTAIGALNIGLYALGMLMFAAIFMFLYSLQHCPYHLCKEHRYAMDDIRVPVLYPIDSGLVYILPSRKYGFDAAFCKKLQSEQEIFNQARHIFEPMEVVQADWTLEKCRASVRKIISAQIHKIEVDRAMINDLGHWLYGTPVGPEGGTRSACQNRRNTIFRQLKIVGLDFLFNKTTPVLKPAACKKRDGYKPVGRDVVLALLLWEYLVFERRWQLDTQPQPDAWPATNAASIGQEPNPPEEKQSQIRGAVWTLRSWKYTGIGRTDPSPKLPNDPEVTMPILPLTKGDGRHIEGFYEAVGEVHRLIGDVKSERPEEAGKEERKFWQVMRRLFATTQTECKGKGETAGLRGSSEDLRQQGREEVENVIRNLDKAEGQKAPKILPQKSVVTALNRDYPPVLLRACSVKDYAGRLWDACWAECPSTFGALYLWTTVWYIDIGNIGFHTTPLLPKGDPVDWVSDGPDYMTVWRME